MKTRITKGLVALMFAGGSLAGFGAVLTGALVGTTAAQATPATCDNDHVDNGQGNVGDPGDGHNGTVHNEDNGGGNGGDPGNGANHDC